MKLHRDIIGQIGKHALQAYPEECCGVITGAGKGQTAHPCENIQNKCHADDPARFPRDARLAYTIDRDELDSIISSVREKDAEILAFYHSHPEHEAFFSEEDVAAQTVFGEPEFPDALHIVISVINREIRDMKCFKWDRTLQKFRAEDECP